MIEQLVDQCHVCRSNTEVIRFVISKMKRGYRTWKAAPREQRRNAMRRCILRHSQNRSLYSFVMRGGY